MDAKNEDQEHEVYIDREDLEILPQTLREDKTYELVPDRTISLLKTKYNRWESYARFAEIAEKKRYHLIGVGEDARAWVFKVLDEVPK
jgi:hypothetical protein